MGYKLSHNIHIYHKMEGKSLTPQECSKICCQKYLQLYTEGYILERYQIHLTLDFYAIE